MNIKHTVKETTELHNDTAALYEALADNEKTEALEIIEKMRVKLLTIKKDLHSDGI